MSKEQKMLSAFSNILYVKEGVRISPTDIRSTKVNNVLSEENLQLIKKYEPYFNKIEEIVTFVDSVRNPYGIYKMLKDYALENGTQHKKSVEFIDNETGKPYIQKIDDYYEPNDPDEYVMIIIDHISLISCDSDNGRKMSLHESISKLSSEYLVQLRNKYKYIPVVIQQQAAAGESLEYFKANKLKPSADTLAENKLTSRDCDTMLGLFSPFRHEIPEYMGYNVKIFRDNIRFLEIVAGREGGAGTVCPLYFDGATNYFKELPHSDDKENLNKVYEFLKTIRNK